MPPLRAAATAPFRPAPDVGSGHAPAGPVLGGRRWCALAMAAIVACAGCARGADLQPVDAFDAIVEASAEHALVALGEFHLMQQWHDFFGELLARPDFTDNVDDIAVEFGNALYQDVADRFILDLEDVAFEELAQIWRNTIGGRVLWDAPVYEQFFRNVRVVNEELPRERRIRVLLGDPDVDFARVRSAADTDELDKGEDRDGFFAGVVEREVLARGRRAVLIAGADHLRRGVHANSGPDDPTVAILLARAHAAELFVVYPLPFDYDQGIRRRTEGEFGASQPPSLAYLDATWLENQPVPHRAIAPDSTFGEQVDAVLWFGPADSLTASRPDPELYRSGEYAEELRRRSAILSEYYDESIDYIAEGLQLANAGPDLYGP